MPGDAASQGGRPRLNGLVFNVAVTAVDVGVAILAFQWARAAGASDATAYFIGSVGPLLGTFVVWLRAREMSGASIAVLAFTVLSAVAALAGSHNPQLLLYKDAVVTGLVGLVFAGSMLFPRPLAFYFAQRYATDGTHAGMQAWNELWQYRLFRRAQYVVTAVWAVTYLAEAGGKSWIISRMSFNAAYTWTQVLPWVATGAALAATVPIARHYRAAGQRQAAQAERALAAEHHAQGQL